MSFKVLVTGGAGFIGSHVVDRLVTMGIDIVVIDNLFSGKKQNLQDHIKNERIAFVKDDVRKGKTIAKLVRGTDAVVHLAAIASVPVSIENPILTNDINVSGTLNLLKACSDAGVGRFVFASSCAVYGEPKYLPIDEKHSTEPLSPYAFSKLAAEHYCQVFSKVYGLSTVILRLFNVYGVRQISSSEGGVVAKFAECLRERSPLTIYGDGSQTRDFVHVSDVVDAIVLAFQKKSIGGEVFNIGSGKPTSICTLAKTMLNLAGSTLDIVNEAPRLGDIKNSFASVEKSRKMLGYVPKMMLQEGLNSLICGDKRAL